MFVSFLTLVSFINAFACVFDIRSHRKDFRKAKNVFIGKVLNIESNLILPEDVKEFHSQTTALVEFEIKKSWKGTEKAKIKVWGFSDNSNCDGFTFAKDQEYLIYTFKNDSVIYTSTTSFGRTRPLQTNNKDRLSEIKELNSFWFRFWAKINPF